MGDKIKKKDKKLLMEFINGAIENYFDSAIENYIDEHIDELRDKILHHSADTEVQSVIADTAADSADDDKVKQLQAELDEMKKEAERLKADNKRLKEENDELRENARENSDRVLESMRRSFKIEKERDTLKNECKAIKATQNNLIAEKNDLQHRFDVLAGLKNSVQSDYNDLKAEFNEAKKTLEQTESELSKYKQTYSPVERIYKLYQNFDEDTKTSLRGIFNDAGSPLDFLCGGVQINRMDSLWEYLKNRFNSGQLSQAQQDDFNELFDFCFTMANKGKAIYTRLSADTDVDFNSEEMSRTSDSDQVGAVREVLLAGYRYIDGNTVKKTLVRLG